MVPSLELTLSPLKMDDWKTIVPFWDGRFSGAMLVSGSQGGYIIISIFLQWLFLMAFTQVYMKNTNPSPMDPMAI